MSMTLISDSFPDGGKIPAEYTCTGKDISPPLSWGGAPRNTATFALIVEDPDAPGGTYDHWVIFNIPPGAVGLAEAIPGDGRLPDGSLQGKNSAGKSGYMGPCPPSGEHRYIFRLFAVDRQLPLEPGVRKKELLAALSEHVLAEADLTGLYGR